MIINLEERRTGPVQPILQQPAEHREVSTMLGIGLAR
jgi:hypothetical protein